MHDSVTLDDITSMFNSKSRRSIFTARQLLFSMTPASHFVENYLYDNEGRPQKLDKFPMMRHIYDNMPQKLLLKCSRKTLKSTLLSNFIALNMIRWNYYKMLYVAPQEASAAYFSNNYVNPRFDSPKVKELFIKGWANNDVYSKKLADSQSSIIFKYVKEDATRVRGPATDQNLHDEIQDIVFDQIPIISETMTLSDYKRQIFAGTPLTTDNTINLLWESSNMLEWATKCEGCNHWNTLTMDNNPLDMLQSHGFSCSKCKKRLNTCNGEWVSFNPKKNDDLVGYHLAQPILPFFNQSDKEWKSFYRKVTDGKYGLHQVYNEALGLAFDVGTKPITEKELRDCCVLGPQRNAEVRGRYEIYENNKWKYKIHTCGVDWGVNQATSRTVVVFGGMRDDGVFEVYYADILEGFDYKGQIREIASLANGFNSMIACDAGPDPARGIDLAQLTSPNRCQLVRYERSKVIQKYLMPSEAWDWRQNRWILHRSDTITFLIRLLKDKKILFPTWDEMSVAMRDILNVYIEVKESDLRQDLFYRKPKDASDDFLHALNWAVCQAYVMAGDSVMNAASTQWDDDESPFLLT